MKSDRSADQDFRLLTALPVYNESKHLNTVLDQVVQHADDVLVVDDGSDDATAELLAARDDVLVVTHPENRGYGAALRTAFCYAKRHEYQRIVTIDCDGQHEPQRIKDLAGLCRDGVDIVSGSRYLDSSPSAARSAPADRRAINHTITKELNARFGLDLTDAFCGFKAYRVEAVGRMRLREDGYAMPLELWVQAASLRLTVLEAAVPLIYLDEERTFGGALDDAEHRLKHYRATIDRAVERVRATALAAQPDPCLGSAQSIYSQPSYAG